MLRFVSSRRVVFLSVALCLAAAALYAQSQAARPIVQKPNDYWRAYRTDMIRQVFDGGFGSDVDLENPFKLTYNTYVEAFSSNCHAFLPANHRTLTVTQYQTKSDAYGNVRDRQVTVQGTVDVDPRFATKYKQFGEELTSEGSTKAAAMAVASGRATVADTFAPAMDVFQFFKTEPCNSPAMRQLGENLLRGAMGQRSLQQLTATAAPPATPGMARSPMGLTHLVDACNAFYRDPANARYAPSDATAYCTCLGEHVQPAMSPEEEAYFAADFEARFRDNILQPKNAGSHPAWDRLHPLAHDCAR
jgi:hypothetical protein